MCSAKLKIGLSLPEGSKTGTEDNRTAASATAADVIDTNGLGSCMSATACNLGSTTKNDNLA